MDRPAGGVRQHIRAIALGLAAALASLAAWAVGPFLPAPPMSPADVPVLGLALLFGAGASVVWLAGIHLSDTTDVLSARLGLGEALGGLLFLPIATNLPEIAIVASAAMGGDLGLAIGNILVASRFKQSSSWFLTVGDWWSRSWLRVCPNRLSCGVLRQVMC